MRFLDTIPANKPRSQAAMVAYLKGHFRYNTMNSWNLSTSYANNVKFRMLHFTVGQREACYDMLQVPEAWDGVTFFMREFGERHTHTWQMGFNGRSSGYLVLYQGGVKDGSIFTQPGKSLDTDEDFAEWDMDSLKSRVDLVWDFDQTCERCVASYVEFAEAHRVEERTVMIPKTVQVAVAKE